MFTLTRASTPEPRTTVLPTSKAGNAGRPDSPQPSSSESGLSVFDILNRIRRRLFIARAALIEQVSFGTKDEEGHFDYVELDPGFHSSILKRTSALFNKGEAKLKYVKASMFIFVLQILNDGQATDALALGEQKINRLRHEEKRLARKRSCAAKREREREAAKYIPATDSAPIVKTDHGKKCVTCGRLFNSRKTYRRHACVTKAGEKTAMDGVAAFVAAPESGPVPPETVPVASPEPNSAVSSPVTVPSEESPVPHSCRWCDTCWLKEWLTRNPNPECENCAGTPATHALVHAWNDDCTYPKCTPCVRGRGETLLPF